MKSHTSLFNLKGSIALLILVVGTIAVALVPDHQHTTTPAGGSAAGFGGKFSSVLRSRGSRIPVFVVSEANVTTDKADYRPGQVVHITGGGFGPGEVVRLEVDYKPTGLAVRSRPDFAGFASGHDPFFVNADGGGNFTADWLVEEDSLNQTLLLTADGESTGLHAQVTFTDASIGTYDQCSNDDGDGYATGSDTGCKWINGNLNANNSTYHEGDSTVQRLWIDGIAAGSTHTVTFQYGTTKGGKHAYDYLTTWDQSENWITLADRCQDITGCTTAGETTFAITNDPNVTDTIENPPAGPLTRLFTARGATITAVSTPTIVSGSYGADSETQITVTVQLANSGPMCDASGCGVAIWFGAHIARTDQWTPFNGTTGATTIPGSPYHVSLAALDGNSIGNRDNQMQANAIVPPTGLLTITKTTLGGFDTFGFTASPTPSPIPGTFSLTTTAQNNPNSISFAAVPAGTYRFAENAPPAGWTLFSLTCSGDTDGGNLISLANRRVDIDLDNTEGQNCTFVNIKPDARIVLSPITATNEIGNPHTITATVTQNDQLDAGTTGGDGTTGLGPAPDGTTVNFSLLNNTAGATFVGPSSCVTAGGTGTCTVQITSSTVGGVDVHATTTFNVLGVALTRASGDGISGDGVNAHKDYVSGTIGIATSQVNEVGHAHTFTITVTQQPGAATPATSANITVTPNPVPGSVTNNCINPVAFVGNTATCTYVINSTSAGVFTVNASATFTIGSVTVSRTTNGSAGNSGPATKRYVDLRISVGPLTATNNVGVNHTFTFTVLQDDGFTAGAPGDATSGFGPAVGAVVNTNLLNNTAGATYVGPTSCTTGAAGTCTVTITSTSAGGVDIHGTTTFSVGGVSMTRANGDGLSGDSANAHKDYVAGSLTLVKRVVNDNGGTAVASSFGITTNAGTPVTFGGGAADGTDILKYTSNTFNNLAPGTYTLHENTLTGYTEGTWSCTGAAAAANGNPQTGSILIAANENVVCTITNNDNPASLRLIKALNYQFGGTRPASDWTTSAAGPTPISGAGGVGPTNVNAGSYTLSETGTFAGYTNGTTYSCVKNGGGAVVSNSLSLALGDTAVCTITNSDSPASLRLIKALNYTHGGTRPATDWTTSAAGPSPISGAGGVGPSNVSAGTYTLSETGTFAGYTNGTTYSCVKNGNPPVSSNSISLAVGDTAVCTITNSDNPASLQLVKTLNYTHGGTRPATDWTTSAAGPSPISGAGGVGPSNVNAGTYTLSETGTFTGYTNGTTYSCVKTPAGGAPGAPVSSNSLSLAVGDSAVCTITNSDNPISLRLIKSLNFTHGGTRLATDWTTSAAGPTPISGAGGVGPSSVLAGTYTLSETGTFAGYTNGTTYSCVTNGGAPVSGNSISLVVGDTAVCTITNSDNPASLRLIKALNYTHGGTRPATDWTTSAAGPTPISGAGGVGPSNVNAGAYTLSETGTFAGYLNGTTYSCVKTPAGGAPGAPVSSNSLSLAVGDSAVCTITNTDIGPALIIVKNIVNDNGGTAVLSNFGLSTTAGPLTFLPGVPSGTTTTYTSMPITGLSAGVAYSLHEGTLGGYSEGPWGCDVATPTSTNAQTGSVMLPLGATVTCTITNNDQPGKIIVRKVTDPLNDPTQFTFLATGTGYNGFVLTGVSTGTPPANENMQMLNAGNYTVAEQLPLPSGWIPTGVSCLRTANGAGTSTADSTDTPPFATVHLAIGDTVTCTFENTRNLVTRTQGFWSTHPNIAQVAWFGGDWNGVHFPGVALVPGIGDTMLCTKNIDSLEKLMGGFWSQVSQTCDDGRRSNIDKSRMTLLQQLLAAELNASAFGSVPPGGSGKFAEWEAAYCSINATAINSARGQAGTFNESGDSGTFTPGTNAQAKLARQMADICFWDNTTAFAPFSLKGEASDVPLIEKP